MMASTQEGSSQLYRIFRLYDPEAAAVVSVVLGLLQVLLAAPIYFMIFKPFLYVVPLIIGILFVTGGSFAFACSKYPNRRLLKRCAYSNMACLLGALVAVCVYIVVLCSELPQLCLNVDEHDGKWGLERTICEEQLPRLHRLFHGIVGSLLVYNIAAMILHSLLSYSAVKGLKID
ncbi:uncharacterized protein LOC143134599 [Alosa pseudoharengus]|uniref:uncharacterized protein LOC143134599 n=1 Tax=Alosa pseudoharengus TaxID=34774 RepID=UPI003F8B7AF9